MAHALLLSPDDQAVNAITGVLEEMSVTCERPLDGVSAAQKLNSQSFDLVLVDCENLPAAKLIFDVCRRAKAGNNPVPIAIVDGRAGLPTAFRLGAELILTKPVSKDQARTTIRTAVSRVRKEVPAAEIEAPSALFQHQHLDEPGDDHSSSADSALMGAAMTGSAIALDFSPVTDTTAPPLMDYAEPAPSFVPAASVPVTSPISTGSAVPDSGSIASYIKEAKSEETPLERPKPSSVSRPEAVSTSVAPGSAPKPALVMRPSDDPVLAELEQTEIERERQKLGSASIPKAPADQFREAAVLRQSQRRRNGMLVGTLMLALAVGGFYAVWNYQPGFKRTAESEISHALSVFGVALPHSKSAPVQEGDSNPVVVPAAKTATDLNSAGQMPTAGEPAGSPATAQTPVTAPVGSSPAESKPEIAKTSASSGTTAATADEATGIKVAATKPESFTAAEAKPEAVSSTPLPNSGSALILSSQGAQKRLLYSVQPKYSAEERARGAQGSIVLKTLVKNDGKVAEVRLVEGNPVLAPAAIDAVRQWRYRPIEREGKAQPFQTVVIVDPHKP